MSGPSTYCPHPVPWEEIGCGEDCLVIHLERPSPCTGPTGHLGSESTEPLPPRSNCLEQSGHLQRFVSDLPSKCTGTGDMASRSGTKKSLRADGKWFFLPHRTMKSYSILNLGNKNSWGSTSLLGLYPKELCLSRDTHSSTVPASLFTRIEKWTLHKRPSIDD